jgi:hypothetical protein
LVEAGLRMMQKKSFLLFSASLRVCARKIQGGFGTTSRKSWQAVLKLALPLMSWVCSLDLPNSKKAANPVEYKERTPLVPTCITENNDGGSRDYCRTLKVIFTISLPDRHTRTLFDEMWIQGRNRSDA